MLMNAGKRGALFALSLMVALSACATAGPQGTRRGSSTRLVAADFEEYVNEDILTVIQRMRPQWVRVRGGGTVQGKAIVQIFVDGMRQNGGPDVLRSIRASSVEEVSFMNANDATTRYGTDMAGGAIEVTTKH